MCKVKNSKTLIAVRLPDLITHIRITSLTSHADHVANAKLLFYESDAKFFRQLFGSDANVHLPHLRKLAARQFPKEPGENFVICVDYTNPEYPAGTCSLKNIKTYKFQDLEGDPAELENVNRQNAEMIKMYVCSPSLISRSVALMRHYCIMSGSAGTLRSSRSSREPSYTANKSSVATSLCVQTSGSTASILATVTTSSGSSRDARTGRRALVFWRCWRPWIARTMKYRRTSVS